MQQQEMERLLRNLSRQQYMSPEAAQAAERIRTAMQTQQGQQTAQNILRSHSSSLEQAARLAQSGDLEGAKKSIQSLMRTPEGARLAAQLSKLMGR